MVEDERIECDETMLMAVAKVIGPASAAAKALADLERRRQAGEDAAIYEYPAAQMLVVGPRLTATSPSQPEDSAPQSDT